LLDPDLLDAEGDPTAFLHKAFNRLGQAAKSPAILDPTVIKTAKASVPTSLTALWTAVVAREMLLAAQIANPIELRAASEALGVNSRPFGDTGPNLEELLGLPVAAALVPLDVPGGRGAPAQVWLVQHSKNGLAADRQLLAASPHLSLPENTGLFLVQASDRASVDGRSWELAAAVAAQAFQQAQPKEAVMRLACEWIVTGEVVSGGRVGEVKLGNKPDLAPDVGERYWLLPGAEADFVTPHFERAARGRLRYADTLAQAFPTVFEDAHTLTDPSENWPEKVHTLHLFTTPALGSLVASALWSNPQRIVLWTSDAMQPLKPPLARVLGDLARSRRWEIEERPINDKLVEAAESDLLAHETLGGGAPEDKLVYFNITGGNFLMRLAAVHVARLNPRLRLVYRSEQLGEKNQNDEFTRIRYTGYRARAAILRRTDSRTSQNAAEKLLKFHPRYLLDESGVKLETQQHDEGGHLDALAKPFL